MALFGHQLALSHNPPALGKVRAQAAGRAAAPPASYDPLRPDFSKILVMVPAEAVAPFVSFKSTTPAGMDPYWWGWVAFGLCLLICVALRAKATQPKSAKGLGEINLGLVALSAVAFFIWAHATSDYGALLPVFHGPFAGLVAIVFGIVVPAFVPNSVASPASP